MFVQWSEEAIKEITVRYGSEAQVWKLVFDSEDCGCSVDGVPTFWSLNTPDEGDLRAESNAYEVCYAPQHAVFFDDLLRVTYNPISRSFTLASDGQIYTSWLKLEDKRQATATIQKD